MKRMLLLLLVQLLLEPELLALGNRVIGPDTRRIDQVARAFFNQTQNDGPGGGSGGGEINAITERFFTGAVASDQFGFSVASAGDVNGDGYTDVIVGAPFNDAGGNSAGRAYIYFGGTIINTIADVILTGVAAGDQFGVSVASAGDVNGDGYQDIVVGANLATTTDTGKAYIYFGGTIIKTIADVILTGVAAGDHFGISVASAGDVDGDGYQDIVVGANLATTGKAYIYFGGAIMNSIIDVTLTGAAAADLFGVSVASAGDVNGDGYSDVIVGAPFAGAPDAGKAYIYLGGAAMDNTPDVTLTAVAASDRFGFSVAGAGDVNGDGYSDVIVGAQNNDAGGADAGRAYVFFGSASMDNIADVILTGAAALDQFGYSVAGAGDVNGDGYADVIVGSPFNDVGGNNAGRALIFFVSTSMDNVADVITTGATADDSFGRSVAGAGDVNGDGYGDVMVGAQFNDAGGSNAGRAYVYLNSLTGTDVPDEFFTGAPGDNLGISAASAGDVNGDGFDDIVVGAYLATILDTGKAYIYFGGVGMDNSADVTLIGVATTDWFGFSVAGSGDVNGDGYGDVIVGAYIANMAYIFFGGTSMDNVADVTLTGEAGSDGFGFSVAGSGDVNGDGYSDVIVGAYGNDAGGVNAGRAYVYFGGAVMNSIADVTLTGAAAADFFGFSAAGTGDVNGDGYSDVIVGASGNDVDGVNAGRAYVYFGGAVMNNIADVTLTGAAASDFFGTSVASADDVNDDGYSDVIVGAYNAGGTGAGQAYIFLGGASMDDVADVTLAGAAPNDFFGFAVAGVGDVNGDGYSDVIVGASFLNSGAGRAYVYFGGAAMDNSADVTMIGTAADEFDRSVAGAGDVNVDGYSDVIVGAHGNDAGGADAGRAYLYLSSSPPIIPRIASIKDVPFDQGGYVRLAWIRSGYDARNIGRVTSYKIERSYPPGIGGFQWEQIANVTAGQNPQYLYTAPTPFDSTSNSSGTFFFRVTALTSNVNEYWRSNIMSGHSVDNLSPIPPQNAQLIPLGGNISRLRWDPNNSDPDVGYYRVYRSTTDGFPLSDSTLLAVTTDTSLTDSPPVSGVVYRYRITTVDIHGNESAPSPQLTAAVMSIASIAMIGGWNMISVPLTVSDYAKTTLFPTAVSDAFAYQGSYVVRPVLMNGEGYWLRYNAAENVSIAGFILDLDTITVAVGWNMIGSIAAPVADSTIISIPPGIITSQFFGYNGAYFSASVIEPGKGYWVRTTQAGQLVLANSPSPEGRIIIQSTQEMPPSPPVQTSLGTESDTPRAFTLSQNYPNPFNPVTRIEYALPHASRVRLTLYNVLGQLVATLVDEERPAGRFAAEWNGSIVSSGVYFYRLEANSTQGNETSSLIRKMILMK
ncbi:MAG TPA: FG-GAP-like repeat-containing protein [Bacteroidota bacterium]